MTDTEQREWVRMLGNTPEAQARMIRHLLKFAQEDRMSSEDRTICRAQLFRLTGELYERAAQRKHVRTLAS